MALFNQKPSNPNPTASSNPVNPLFQQQGFMPNMQIPANFGLGAQHPQNIQPQQPLVGGNGFGGGVVNNPFLAMSQPASDPNNVRFFRQIDRRFCLHLIWQVFVSKNPSKKFVKSLEMIFLQTWLASLVQNLIMKIHFLFQLFGNFASTNANKNFLQWRIQKNPTSMWFFHYENWNPWRRKYRENKAAKELILSIYIFFGFLIASFLVVHF